MRIILVSLCLLLSVHAYAESDVVNLLNKMTVAAEKSNYQGIFTVQSNNKMQSIRIIHRADKLGEIERLVSLNGVPREVIRNNDMMMCIYPEGQKVQVNHRPLGGGFPTDLLRRLMAASDYYQLVSGQQGRIAAQQSQELMLKPIDQYRYGYRLWLDQNSYLLLQSEMIDNAGNALESYTFSSVEQGGSISDVALQAEMKGNEMSWDRLESDMERRQSNLQGDSLWQVTWLPVGFSLISQQQRIKANNGAAVEQHVYSDGLSSISVFFEKIRARHSQLHGGAQRGAVNIFGSISNAHFITVVGEVPAQTVEKVGNSIQLSKQ